MATGRASSRSSQAKHPKHELPDIGSPKGPYGQGKLKRWKSIDLAAVGVGELPCEERSIGVQPSAAQCRGT